MSTLSRKQSLVAVGLVTLGAGLAVACSSSGGSNAGSAATGGSAAAGGSSAGTGNGPGQAGAPGACDIAQVFAKTENGCTNSNCHGSPFQGGLDLASPGLAGRLVGVASTSQACSGQLLIDSQKPEESLLLRLVDPAAYAASPHQCGVLMPFGSNEGLSGNDLACMKQWVASAAAGGDDGGTMPLPFEAVGVESYLQKVKTLLNGGAVTADELNLVKAQPAALRMLVEQWTAAPAFQDKMHDFLSIALQQRLVGTLDFEFDKPRGPFTDLLESNTEESFLRTALNIIENRRPFTEVLTTRRFAVTTGLLVAMAYTDRTTRELASERQMLYRTPPAGTPAAPWSLAYSLQSKSWLLPALPDDCNALPLSGTKLFDMLYGFVVCPSKNVNVESGTVLTAADFADWHFVDFAPSTAQHPRDLFYRVDDLRSASKVYLDLPRVGFFTTPAFFGNWDTNDGNQFRVTTSQTMIAALGEVFSPGDSTDPVRGDGLDAEHAPPTSTCYGCHQFLDPMRGYFSRTYSTDYQATATPTTAKPSFAFLGVTADEGNIDTFAQTLASHPLLPTAWVQKLCFYANSQGCDASDPEVLRIAKVFADSDFDFITLVQELFTSPLVTGVSATQSYATRDPIVSITRRQHFCQLIDERLGTQATCAGAGSVVGLIPMDEFSRGSEVPVQPAETSLFHFAAAEKLCGRITGKLVGAGLRFDPADPTTAIADMVSQLMALNPSHSRASVVQEQLSKHYAAARAAGASPGIALKDTFTVACMSPDVMGLGL